MCSRKSMSPCTCSQRLEIMVRISTPSILRSGSYRLASEAKYNIANYLLHLASSLLVLTFQLDYFPAPFSSGASNCVNRSAACLSRSCRPPHDPAMRSSTALPPPKSPRSTGLIILTHSSLLSFPSCPFLDYRICTRSSTVPPTHLWLCIANPCSPSHITPLNRPLTT